MTQFRWRMAAALGAIVVVFIGLVAYVGSVAPQMARDSAATVNTFYSHCRQRHYVTARELLSSTAKDTISAADLEKEWRKFAERNGPFQRWEAANKVSIAGFGGSVCVFPPFVDFRHAVFGGKGTGTLIYMRVVPENGKWKIERFTVLR